MGNERLHAKWSPSKLVILEKCPRWVSDGKSSEIAQRGTTAGEIVANYACNWVQQDNPEAHIEYGYEMIKGLNLPFWAPEVKLDTGIPDVWGYADLVSAGEWDSEASLVEIKTGYGDRPPASANIQIQAYALGLLNNGYTIVNVYLLELDKCTWSAHVYTSADMGLITERIKKIISLAEGAGEYSARPGSYCNYCGKIESCPEVSLTPETAVSLLEGKNMQQLTPQDFARALSPADLGRTLKRVLPLMTTAELYVGHLKARAIALLEVGDEVPGFTLKDGRSTRKWADEGAALEALVAEGGDVWELTELKSPAQVEKISKDIKKIVSTLTVKKAGNKILEELK